jgi:hypothetical protein
MEKKKMIEKIIIALNGEIERLIRDHKKKMARVEKCQEPDSRAYYTHHAKMISDMIKHYKDLINFLEQNRIQLQKPAE